MHRSTPLNYYPKLLFRNDRREKKTQHLNEMMVRRNKELNEKTRTIKNKGAASTIQRAFRYYYSRKLYKEKRYVVAQERHSRWKQRKKDDVRNL